MVVTAAGFRTLTRTGIEVTINNVTRVAAASRGRPAQRAGDRLRLRRRSADRPLRHPRRDQLQDRRGTSAAGLPELSEHDQPGSRRHARGVPELDGRIAAALADHQRERHQPQQQQHPHRRRHQRLRLAAPPHPLQSARRIHRDREHLHVVVRRRAGHGRRRRRHGRHQVRHQPAPRLRLLVSRQPAPLRPAVLLQVEHRSPRAEQVHRQHPRRHHRRPDHQEQAVLLLQLRADLGTHRPVRQFQRAPGRRARRQFLGLHRSGPHLRPAHRRPHRHRPHALRQQQDPAVALLSHLDQNPAALAPLPNQPVHRRLRPLRQLLQLRHAGADARPVRRQSPTTTSTPS